ncbi:phage tail protein [Paenibacillus campi]|uniref:phage tail protein n=1 Tax=Paenibacillus campi TaxID=3106031 RepID=UPI002AFFCD69|nr:MULTISPECIES: tail fiber protein [unclassified Paenibacillus]
MGDYFLGEIRLFPYGVIPKGWLACNGQLLDIRSNAALFSLLVTTYGGDGRNNFALPDLRGRVPIHLSTTITGGAKGGQANHVLTVNEMPAHSHTLNVSQDSASESFAGSNVLAKTDGIHSYASTAPNAQMASTAIGTAGANVAHNNMQPYLTLNFCISTTGIYPQRP